MNFNNSYYHIMDLLDWECNVLQHWCCTDGAKYLDIYCSVGLSWLYVRRFSLFLLNSYLQDVMFKIVMLHCKTCLSVRIRTKMTCTVLTPERKVIFLDLSSFWLWLVGF